MPRSDAVLIKIKKEGAAIQNASNITRVLDPCAGAPVVTSVALNSRILVALATGGGFPNIAKSHGMGVE